MSMSYPSRQGSGIVIEEEGKKTAKMRLEQNSIFWTWYGSCTYKLKCIVLVCVCARPAQIQARKISQHRVGRWAQAPPLRVGNWYLPGGGESAFFKGLNPDRFLTLQEMDSHLRIFWQSKLDSVGLKEKRTWRKWGTGRWGSIWEGMEVNLRVNRIKWYCMTFSKKINENIIFLNAWFKPWSHP